jgi:hypothetical protein
MDSSQCRLLTCNRCSRRKVRYCKGCAWGGGVEGFGWWASVRRGSEWTRRNGFVPVSALHMQQVLKKKSAVLRRDRRHQAVGCQLESAAMRGSYFMEQMLK